jgi:hypothetical protein
MIHNGLWPFSLASHVSKPHLDYLPTHNIETKKVNQKDGLIVIALKATQNVKM